MGCHEKFCYIRTCDGRKYYYGVVIRKLLYKGGRSGRDKVDRRRSAKATIPPSSDARRLWFRLSQRSSSYVYSWNEARSVVLVCVNPNGMRLFFIGWRGEKLKHEQFCVRFTGRWRDCCAERNPHYCVNSCGPLQSRRVNCLPFWFSPALPPYCSAVVSLATLSVSVTGLRVDSAPSKNIQLARNSEQEVKTAMRFGGQTRLRRNQRNRSCTQILIVIVFIHPVSFIPCVPKKCS